MAKFIQIVSLYCLAEVVTLTLKRSWPLLYQYALQYKHCWTYGVVLTVTSSWAPVVGGVLPLLAHAAFVVLALRQEQLHRSGPGVVQGRGLVYKYTVPSFVAAVVAVSGSLFSSFWSAPSGVSIWTVAALLVLHGLSCASVVAKTMIYPAPLVADFMLPFDALRESNLDRLGEKNIVVFKTGTQGVSTDVPTFPLTSFPPSSATTGTQNTTAAAMYHQPRLEVTVLYQPHVLDATMSRKWMLYIGGNGEVMEATLPSIASLAKDLGANGIAFNFRGVGNSEGVTTGAASMIADAVAVIDAIQQRHPHVQERDIIVFGHSIGGGVAAQVVAHHKKNCSLVLDRTFSSLGDAASMVIPQPAWLRNIGVAAIFGDFLTSDSLDAISHDRWAVTFHREDRIIAYGTSSLARIQEHFGAGKKHERKLLELVGRSNDAHNCELSRFGESASRLLGLMRGWYDERSGGRAVGR